MTGPRWGKMRWLLIFVVCFCFFVFESKKCGSQQRDAMNWIGCKGDVDQTSKAGQFLRLHHSTWKKVYIINSTESQCSLAKVAKDECV